MGDGRSSRLRKSSSVVIAISARTQDDHESFAARVLFDAIVVSPRRHLGRPRELIMTATIKIKAMERSNSIGASTLDGKHQKQAV